MEVFIVAEFLRIIESSSFWGFIYEDYIAEVMRDCWFIVYDCSYISGTIIWGIGAVFLFTSLLNFSRRGSFLSMGSSLLLKIRLFS
jgi:hypothetical protein